MLLRRAVLLCVSMLLTAAVSPVAAADDPYADWAAVLDRYVDQRGLVDFEGLAADRAPLDRFVAWVGRTAPWTDPAMFPDRESEIAYYVNSYNALSMAGILAKGVPEDLDGIFARYGFFKRTKYRIGDRDISLYAYENDIIRDQGEPRVHFVLNCMSIGCPRLLRQPLRGSTLEQQLDAATREFFNSPRHVEVADGSRGVRVSEILKWFEEDFVGKGGDEAVVAYVNRYRDDKVPAGARLGYIDYDWTVIDQRTR